MSTFQGKVALVTGGGSGIGKSVAETFAREGAKVVVTGRRLDPLQALSARYPESIAFVQADVTKSGDARKAVDFTVEKFGRLDVLVNNAGTFVHKPLVETTDEDIAHVFAVNVSGVLAFSREAVPHLQKVKGNIVTISSAVGTGVMPNSSAYSGTKAAVDHISRVLAVELGPVGIRVNVVSPGVTKTDMAAPLLQDDGFTAGIVGQTPLGRIGLPEDIANVVSLLASDKAGWVTGQVVTASGGLLL